MTREDWLHAFTEAARERFADAGFPLPANIRSAIGFCSTGRAGKRIGECWASEASADGAFEIFIVPTIAQDSARIADILTHELCHAATPGAGHGKAFKQCATALGLEGQMTATVAGPHWHHWAGPILKAIGPIPGATLDAGASRKKQTTRMLKCECEACGFTFRVSGKWADKDLRCPDTDCGGTVNVERN